MIPPTLGQLERLARLADQAEFGVLLDWLRAGGTALTRAAIRSADAQACGAASEMQDLIDTLANAKLLYDRARKTTASGSGAFS